MADPFSVAASALTVVIAAIHSTQSLYETVKSFKDRNKTLQRLQNELKSLIDILNLLSQVADPDLPMMNLLHGPVDRCRQVCREFERSMKIFNDKSKTGFRDWAKMEYMRGDINEFIDSVAEYKSTISIGLGTITMHTTKVTQKLLQEYDELVQDTAYNLELRLQQINDKMEQLPSTNTHTSDITIDLKDEREVTEQCLRVCEDARVYIESLAKRESPLLREASQNTADKNTTEEYTRKRFEAQLLTNQVLDDNRDSLNETVTRLQTRLKSIILNGPRSDSERLQLQEDIEISKQCLEVCKMANEASRQKVYRIGEVVADGESDQVVVTTLADLFDINKALSKGNSAQLVGSMTDESLQHLTEKRYSSRFGALAANPSPSTASTTRPPPTAVGVQRSTYSQPQDEVQTFRPKVARNRSSPNEMRKRVAGDVVQLETESS